MIFFGLVLIAFGILALLKALGIINIAHSLWDYFWPVVIIALGISILWGRHRMRVWRRHWSWREHNDDVTKQ